MTLTPNLRRFWDDLNVGSIDWKFLLDSNLEQKTQEEINQGWEILEKRGFITYDVHQAREPTYSSPSPRPSLNKKQIYFRSKKYLDSYACYLKSKKPNSS